MRAKLITAGVMVLVAAGLPLSASHAATPTPVDCPGIVAVTGGYRLTKDVECSLDGRWWEDGTTVDLAGHTLTGQVYPTGDGQTLRNGTLVTDFDWWWLASDFTVSHVTVQPPAPGGCLSFCIEAGNVTVEHSTFRDIGGIALDFYFGGGGTIRDSRFVRNRIGVSIQADDGLVIERNRFEGNGTGLNLWTEEGYGVNHATIVDNAFRANGVGMSVHADDRDPWDEDIVSHNRIEDNQFLDNDEAGLAIEVDCYDDAEACDRPAGNVVAGNRFWHNGVDPGSPPGDGVRARGQVTVWDRGDGSIIDLPEALAGFTLTDNRAHHNADLGFDVLGVTDGGGNRAWANGNPAQCVGLDCNIRVAQSALTASQARTSGRAPLEQVAHADTDVSP